MFAGNTHDIRTVQTIVDTMEARHGVSAACGSPAAAWPGCEPGVAAPDRAALHHRDAQHELAPIRRRAGLSRRLGEIRDGIEVKLARWPETGETAILCRSATDAAKSRPCTTSSAAASRRR